MSKPSIYLHPLAKLCSQETDFLWAKKYVPLTKDKITSNFDLAHTQDDADYVFIGQINEGYNIPSKIKDICLRTPRRVIVDIEGDFGTKLFDECLMNTISCAGGPDNSWGLRNCFVRPHLSKVLLELFEYSKAMSYSLVIPSSKKTNRLFFQGQVNVPARKSMMEAINMINFPKKIIVNPQWAANQSVKDSTYCDNMNNSLLSLCPKGVGGSSIRFYESCFFGCVPIILGNDKLMGEPTYDTSFAIRIPDYLDADSILTQIIEVLKKSKEELIDRGNQARKYYEEVVASYLRDPMKEFIKWLNIR